MHLNLRGVQQSLAARSIRCARDGQYADGRPRFAVWRAGFPRLSAQHADSIDMAYIRGLKMPPGIACV